MTGDSCQLHVTVSAAILDFSNEVRFRHLIGHIYTISEGRSAIPRAANQGFNTYFTLILHIVCNIWSRQYIYWSQISTRAPPIPLVSNPIGPRTHWSPISLIAQYIPCYPVIVGVWTRNRTEAIDCRLFTTLKQNFWQWQFNVHSLLHAGIYATGWLLFMRCVSFTFIGQFLTWTPKETFDAFLSKLLSADECYLSEKMQTKTFEGMWTLESICWSQIDWAFCMCLQSSCQRHWIHVTQLLICGR